MTTLLFGLSFAIATIPVFISVWVDRPYFAAVFQVRSYKVALRELLYLSFAVSALAILEAVDAGISGRLSSGYRLLLVLIVFVFLMTILFSVFRYGRIAHASVSQLRTEQDQQVWFSWGSALSSGFGAAVLKSLGA